MRRAILRSSGSQPHSVEHMKAMTLAALLLGLLSRPAFGELIEADDGGFVSAHTVEIAATPEQVLDALVEDVGKWWDPAHTYSGDAANLSFGLGRWLLEEFPDGQVFHMTVEYYREGKTLRLSGGLGPLQPLGVAGSMTFDFEATDAGAKLTYRYVVNGRRLEALAEPVDRVMLGQLLRLKKYVETGSPVDVPRD